VQRGNGPRQYIRNGKRISIIKMQFDNYVLFKMTEG